MSDILQRVACKAIIVRDDKILLLRESATHDTNTRIGKYQFPGGRVEPGETFEAGFRREVMEETGLHVTIGEPFFVSEWFPVIKGAPNHIVGIFFLCQEDGSSEITLSEEHDDYAWVDRTNLDSLALMEPDDLILEKYFSTH